jgi:ribosomal protein S2
MFLKTHSINLPAREFSIPSTLVSEFSIPRYEELKKSFRGLVEKQNTSTYLCFQKKPDLILLVNSTENLSIVREANSLCIPVMALTDSNTNLSGISYPIPVNSESISFFFRFLDLINRVNRRC